MIQAASRDKKKREKKRRIKRARKILKNSSDKVSDLVASVDQEKSKREREREGKKKKGTKA